MSHAFDPHRESNPYKVSNWTYTSHTLLINEEKRRTDRRCKIALAVTHILTDCRVHLEEPGDASPTDRKQSTH